MSPTTSRISRKKILLFVATGILLAVVIVYGVHYWRLRRSRDYVFVQVKPIQKDWGWGYEIITNGKVYIKQEFIPVLQGHHGFQTKGQALQVGNRVVEKIEHHQLPILSLQELEQMQVIPDSLLPR